jgi:hypothetical protein
LDKSKPFKLNSFGDFWLGLHDQVAPWAWFIILFGYPCSR